MQEFLTNYNIKRLYVYHQEPRQDKVIEFGWKDADEIPMDQPLVLSRTTQPESDSAVTLSDYYTYFTNLTSLTPDEFISKWEPSPREYEIFWYSDRPTSEKGLHLFIMKLAYLIRDGEKFEHEFSRHTVSFEIVSPLLVEGTEDAEGVNEN